MIIRSITVPCVPATFKNQGSLLFLSAWILMLFVFMFPIFIFEQTRHDATHFKDLVVLLIVMLLIFFTVIVIKGGSDIVVDDKYICRRRFGWTLQKIYWNNIKVIKSRPYYNPALKKNIKVISVLPLNKSIFRMSFSGLMGFSDQVSNSNELILLVNHYSVKHQIKIEISENGITKYASSL